jgi:hypothetical protein
VLEIPPVDSAGKAVQVQIVKDAKGVKREAGKKYLAVFPKMERWINRCVACQRVGYKPEMPDQI